MKRFAHRLLLLGLLSVGLLAVGGLRADPETPLPVVIGEAVVTSVAVDESGDTAVPVEETTPVVDLAAGMEPRAFLPMVVNPQIFSEEARAVLDIVNAERAQAGCAPVALQEQLTEAAQGHSEDMAINDYFSHTSKDGRSPWQRIQATGYRYTTAGENIAAGYSTPEWVMDGWMNSTGHRNNILNCNFTEMGLGYYYHSPDTGSVNYRHYWTQVFAKPR